MTIVTKLYATLSGRRGKWLVLAITAVAAGLAITVGGTPIASRTAELPASAEAARVAELQRQLPSGQRIAALVVYSRDGQALLPTDRETMRADVTALAPLAADGQVSPPIPAQDGAAALVSVSLPADLNAERLTEAVAAIRAVVRDGLPPGLTAQVTGGAGFQADLASVFDGADIKLLLTTVVVVAVLLLITYRSPWLWLVPLIVIGVAERVSIGLIGLLTRVTPLTVDESVTGIVGVLVFGAGTDYALLLISRYREELRQVPDRHEAMARALTGAGPAILGSAGTVVLSVLTLSFAVLPGNRSLGYACAVGVACALIFGLFVLPAALTVFSRGLFWPFVPRPGQTDQGRDGIWGRIGRAVAGRPRLVLAASLAVLALLSVGLTGAKLGLSQTEQFRAKAESIDGLQTLGRHFPAGAAQPTVVIANVTAAADVLAAVQATPGVAEAEIADRTDTLVGINATLTAAPDTAQSYAAIRELRIRVDAVAGGDALVGGAVAANLDARAASERDLRTIIPLVLIVVLAVLMVLLRAFLGPLLLVGTVVVSYFAALGASVYAFTHWFGFPALDLNVPLLSFLFLVALGVDYNIFLVSRAREEAQTAPTRQAVVTALAVTGGVITSAGVLLAAVFAVLGVLPIITLTEIGIIVGFGVLLDTLLVRTILVPAIVTLLGPRFWWPGRAAGDAEPAAPVAPGPAAPGPAALVGSAGQD
ncbi:MAG TPA: MMPL family transporter [Micromonosporaceae bacterium]|nr:MMPL family transporter [Micromonosporaceae bacterium]